MGKSLPFRLTLASGSVGRRYLMEKWGYTFDIKPADIDEPREAEFGSCQQFVQQVAWLKAAAMAPRIPEGIIIAADSVGWIDNTVIAKPEDEDDARRILQTLSGRVHELWTGVCLWRPSDGMQLAWQERSMVRMKAFTEMELKYYLLSKKWVGCSGAYAIDEENDPYLTVEEGTISNVIGLPMETLEKALEMWTRM